MQLAHAKSQDVVFNYEMLTVDEKSRVPDTKYEITKQFIPGRP